MGTDNVELGGKASCLVSQELQARNEAKARKLLIKAMKSIGVKKAEDNLDRAPILFQKGKLTKKHLFEARKGLGAKGGLSSLITFTIPPPKAEINGVWKVKGGVKSKVGDQKL